MRSLRRAALAASVAIAALAASTSGLAAPPLETAFMQYPTSAFDGPDADVAFARVRAAGAGVAKINLDWHTVAPTRPERRSDPSDPAYNWAPFDAKLRAAVGRGLQPLVMVFHAPSWASKSNGWDEPDIVEFAAFARAAATRYSGTYRPPNEESLPRVRYWQVWNEPNLIMYLSPQYAGRRLVAAATYRAMVNRFSASVKAVHRSNLVLAGGTAPFKATRNSPPLRFMREFLCLNTNLTPKANCGPVRFDIWGHHPYTSGGPTHKALRKDDVSLGDLPAMRRVLRAAAARGKITSNGRVRFWVDEFSWDTNPPDPGGVPMKLHVRWTAEAMYRMWTNGVTLVAWLQLMDNRWTGVCGDPYQSGLYFWSSNVANARPKRSLAAFRFPFVAFRQNGRILVWGRTPGSKRAHVVIERKAGKRWRKVGALRTGANGVFQKRYARPWTRAVLRARIGRTKSVPFSLTGVSDRWFYPFGRLPRAGQCG